MHFTCLSQNLIHILHIHCPNYGDLGCLHIPVATNNATMTIFPHIPLRTYVEYITEPNCSGIYSRAELLGHGYNIYLTQQCILEGEEGLLKDFKQECDDFRLAF